MREDCHQDYLNFQNAPDPHFYEVGRLRIFHTLLDKYIKRSGLNILDIGCGNGDMLDYFKQFGNVKGLETHLPSVEMARKKGFDVKISTIEDWPFEDEKFDVISFFDVLEHIKDDESALKTVHKSLAPGGLVIIAVPAFEILWSFTDIVAQHIRRYTKKELEKKLKNAGFEMVKSTYFNAFLGPFIFAFLLLKRILTFNNAIPTKMNHKYFNHPFINNVCKKILFKEAKYLLNNDFYFGTSIFVIAKK